MSIKAAQNRVKEEIERTKLTRLQVQLSTEREGLRKDYVSLERAQVQTGIQRVGLRTDRLKLQTAETDRQIASVQLGKAQDLLGFESVDRILTQKEYGSKLALKSVNVSALRETVRHQRVLNGDGISVPSIGGGQS